MIAGAMRLWYCCFTKIELHLYIYIAIDLGDQLLAIIRYIYVYYKNASFLYRKNCLRKQPLLKHLKKNSHSWTTNWAVQCALPFTFSARAVYRPESSSLQCSTSRRWTPDFWTICTRSIRRSVKGLLSFNHVTEASSWTAHSKTAFSPAENPNLLLRDEFARIWSRLCVRLFL